MSDDRERREMITALEHAQRVLLDTQILLAHGKANATGMIEIDAATVGRLQANINQTMRKIVPFT